MALVFGTTMMQFDGEEHTKRRNIVAPEFSGRRLEPVLPIIERNTQELIERFSATAAERLAREFADKGEVELIDAFSSRLPVMVIIDMLGLPQEDHDLFHEWYPAMMAGLTGTPEQRGLRHRVQPAVPRLHRQARGRAQRQSRRGSDLEALHGRGRRGAHVQGRHQGVLEPAAGGGRRDDGQGDREHVGPHDGEPRAVRRGEARPGPLRPRVHGDHADHAPSWEPAARRDRADRDVRPDDPGGGPRPTSPSSGPTTTTVCSTTRTSSTSSGTTSTFGRELRSGYYEGGQASHLGFGLGKHFCVGYQLARSEAVIGSKALLAAMGNPRVKAGGKAHIQVAGPMNETPKLELEFRRGVRRPVIPSLAFEETLTQASGASSSVSGGNGSSLDRSMTSSTSLSPDPPKKRARAATVGCSAVAGIMD